MIDYTVVGGFLGAGKTTLINGMLATTAKRLAVIVNDIGELNIDAALIRSSSGDDTIELTNGCVCCSIGDSLATTLRSLCDRPDPPDHVVVECSGAAEPARVAAYGSRKILARPLIIVVADATDIESRAGDPRYGELVRAQLASAAIISVSKTDLVDDSAGVVAWLAANTAATVVVGRPDEVATVMPEAEHLIEPGPDAAARFAVSTRWFDRPVEPETVVEWLQGIDDLVRAKGIIDTNAGPHLLQFASGRFECTPWPGPRPRSAITTIQPTAD